MTTLPIGPVPATDETSHVKQNIAIQQLFKATQQLTNIVPLSNVRNAQTGAYTVAPSDNGKTIALGGTAFYKLTFHTTVSYDPGMWVLVVNEDLYSNIITFTAGRAKWIEIAGTTFSFYLWPGQSVIVYAQADQWRILGKTRWRLPGEAVAALTINTDFTNGSDTLGLSDGLATGAGAFKSIQHALATILSEFDLYGYDSGASLITVLMAAGSTDSNLIHFSPHALVGAQGGAAIKIDGNGGFITGGMQFYFGAVLQIRNVTISSQTSSVNALDVQWGAKVYLRDGVTFAANAANLAAINVAHHSHVELDSDITVTGAGTYLFIAVSGGFLQAALALTITITANITVTNTVLVATCAIADLANVTWALGGHTVTATNRYSVTVNGVLTGSAAVPGSGAGSFNTGGQAL
jgi:hypothetical protein